MKRVLIIGATSAIAQAVSRHYAAQGAALFLVGRNEAVTQAVAQDLRLRGAGVTSTHLLDLNDLAGHEEMFLAARRALQGPIDVVLVAHGSLGQQGACEVSPALTVQEFQTNAVSTIALLTSAANRLAGEHHHPGVLAVITSVAGDRGRRSNYVYGAAKAAVSTFLSGLRQRLMPLGIAVVDIRPGFVDTPMTRKLRKNRLWATPEQVAAGIVRAIDQRSAVVYLPRFWRAVMAMIRILPESVFKHLLL